MSHASQVRSSIVKSLRTVLHIASSSSFSYKSTPSSPLYRIELGITKIRLGEGGGGGGGSEFANKPLKTDVRTCQLVPDEALGLHERVILLAPHTIRTVLPHQVAYFAPLCSFSLMCSTLTLLVLMFTRSVSISCSNFLSI